LPLLQGAMAQVTELSFAHVGGPGSLFEVCANEYARRVNEKLPPAYRVVVYGQSQLGSDTEVLGKIKRGGVTFALPSTVMSTVSPKFGIFELPFLIRNRVHVARIRDALLEPELQPEVRAQGFRILAVWENGFRQITNSLRPIRKPVDLAHMKLRVPKGVWRLKAFRALGADPVPMSLGDTHKALQDRQVDGQENPLAQIHGSKFQEVQRFLTLSDHIYSPAYLITGEKHFASLPYEVRQILSGTASEMQSWIYETAIRIENELLDELSLSMETNQIDTDAFRAASQPFYKEFASSVPGGLELVGKVSELAEGTGSGTNN
jgi:tripartite ATP-independent transporter DctP family solute receptor